MAECIECGAKVAAGQSFCGGCGVEQPAAEASASGSLDQASDHLTPPDGKEVVKQVKESAPEANRHTGQLSSQAESASKQPAESTNAGSSADPKAISSASLGGSATDNVKIQSTTGVPHKGTTGGHQPTIKQLDVGTVLKNDVNKGQSQEGLPANRLDFGRAQH